MKKLFKDVQVGDRLIRMLAGRIPIPVIVTRVDDLITCSLSPEEQQKAKERIESTAQSLGIPLSEVDSSSPLEWTFSINNGAEIDPMLGWTEQYTGSFLVKPKKDADT